MSKEKIIISVGIAGIIALIVLGVTASIEEGKRWKQFKIDHRCEIVGKKKGTINYGNGISPNGQVVMITTTTSDTTGWYCDDGVTYWR